MFVLYNKGQKAKPGQSGQRSMDKVNSENEKISRWGRDFPHPSTPALQPNEPAIKWVLRLLSGGKAAWAWR